MKLLFFTIILSSLNLWADQEPLLYRLLVKDNSKLESAFEKIGVKLINCQFNNSKGKKFSYQGLNPCLYKSFFEDGNIIALIQFQQEPPIAVTIKWQPVKKTYLQYLVHAAELYMEPTVIWISENLFTHPAYNHLVASSSLIGDFVVEFPTGFQFKSLSFTFYPIKKNKGIIEYFGRAQLITSHNEERILDLNTNLNLLHSKRTFTFTGQLYEN